MKKTKGPWYLVLDLIFSFTQVEKASYELCWTHCKILTQAAYAWNTTFLSHHSIQNLSVVVT